MLEPSSKNLSEQLFAKHRQAKETSALVPYMPSSQTILDQQQQQQASSWYRSLCRLQWAWQGVNPIDMEGVLARIASSSHSRTHDNWLDTVMGYRRGNWAYEWTQLGSAYQQQAAQYQGEEAATKLFTASLCFSIAGYPHLNNDSLASQAYQLAVCAYQEGAKATQYVVKSIEIPYKNKHITVTLHLPNTDKPHPVVMVSAGLDSLQTDMWRLFSKHLVPHQIGMVTVDMPAIGQSRAWPLSEDVSCLHQAVLNELRYLPWVDHWRVGLLGFRFGGNAMVRLSFLEPEKVKACVALGAPIHDVLSSPEKLKNMPKMYLDVLASRLGKSAVDIHSLSGQMMAWSLKTQGLLSGRKTKVPILALSLEGDPVSPLSDNRLVSLYSRGGQAKSIRHKMVSKGYEQSLDLAIKWLKEELIE